MCEVQKQVEELGEILQSAKEKPKIANHVGMCNLNMWSLCCFCELFLGLCIIQCAGG